MYCDRLEFSVYIRGRSGEGDGGEGGGCGGGVELDKCKECGEGGRECDDCSSVADRVIDGVDVGRKEGGKSAKQLVTMCYNTATATNAHSSPRDGWG